ncbi:acyl carrier protein [Agaricicola taiwanensis]|uniref:Acyl carrier protein n=1 Tax=Agaricicola taiwanensis TaxID=591372 RepID=A0A8J2VKN2_9RHOB|nr:acyl carrier protein [Agaricicola taiwanensis]GGE29766.1 acyl carrier protein [Agaricicola taiwanensis]
MTDSTESRIRAFIQDNFLFADNLDAFANDASLIEAGVIDSTGVLELVSFLESDFGIHIADADIVPENLDSIASISAFVRFKQASIASVA